MKKRISEESTNIEHKKVLQDQIKELEQEASIMEKLKIRAAKKSIRVKVPTRKLVLTPSKLDS